MLQTLDLTEVSRRHARAAVQGESVETAYPESAPAVQRKTAEALALIRLLAAGDTDLWEVVDDPLSSTAEHLREALLSYLALGSWQGWPLPLQAGSRLSHEARALQTRISAVACESRRAGVACHLTRRAARPGSTAAPCRGHATGRVRRSVRATGRSQPAW